MLESIILRPARAEDLDKINVIEQENFPGGEIAPKEALEKRIQAFGPWFLVAEAGGQVIGFILSPPMSRPYVYDEQYHDLHMDESGDGLGVMDLAVDKGIHGKGIGTLLLEAVFEMARKEGKKYITLACEEHLIPYYEKFSFENKGLSELEHCSVVWYNMVKRL